MSGIRSIVMAPDEPALVDVLAGRITFATTRAATFFGRHVEDIIGLEVDGLFDADVSGLTPGMAVTREAVDLQGRRFYAAVSVPEAGRLEISYLPDAAELVTVARRQRDILEAIVGGDPVEVVLSQIAVFAESHAPGNLRASILRMDPEEGVLRVAGQPSLPPEFIAGIDRLRPGQGVASCGTAAATGLMVLTPSIVGDPWWTPFEGFMAQFGVRASWSTPIRSSRHAAVLGTFGMYYGEPRFPTARELYLAESFAHLAALALDRADADRVRIRQLALLETERLRTAFFASIAHDLRTPLQTIVAAVEILDDQVAPMVPSQRRAAEVLRGAAEQLLHVAEDATQIARPGTVEICREPLDPAVIARRAVTVMFEEASRLQVELRTVLPAVLPQLDADPRRLSRVLVNLLGNAVSHAPTGSTVSLEVTFDAAAHELEMVVVDRGPGLPASMHDRVFEPFVQAGDGGISKGGAGLGLAIVKRFVGAHGGRVGVASEPGQGARFSVFLPVAPDAPMLETAPQSDARTAAARVLDGRTILLAEDDEALRSILRIGLARSGATVLEAGDGLEALRVLGNAHVDVLLLDGWMPKLDGAGVLSGMRQDPPARLPAVVVLSGGAGPTQGGPGWLERGASLVVAKPVRLAALVSAVAGILDEVPVPA